jgi:hypothetical protein
MEIACGLHNLRVTFRQPMQTIDITNLEELSYSPYAVYFENFCTPANCLILNDFAKLSNFDSLFYQAVTEHNFLPNHFILWFLKSQNGF